MVNEESRLLSQNQMELHIPTGDWNDDSFSLLQSWRIQNPDLMRQCSAVNLSRQIGVVGHLVASIQLGNDQGLIILPVSLSHRVLSSELTRSTDRHRCSSDLIGWPPLSL